MSRQQQEFVPVEAVSGGRRRAWLPWLMAGAAAHVCLVLAAAVWWPGRDGETPAPPDAAGPSVQQQTALMWAEWQAEGSTSDCLAKHGYDESPVLYETRMYAPTVAKSLDVTPAYGGPTRVWFAAPVPEVGFDEWDRWHARVSKGGCTVPLGPTDVSDPAEVDLAVAAAAQSEAFHGALAAAAWGQEHAELQLAREADASLAGDRTVLEDRVAARATLDLLVAAGEHSSLWVKLGVEEGTQAIAAYGSDGATPIVIVVEAPDVVHGFEWRYSGVDGLPLVCGGVRVLVVLPQTIYHFDDRDRTADDLWAAMIEACGP